MRTWLKFSPRLAYSALDLVKMPMPTSMPTFTRKLGSARRRSRNPLQNIRSNQVNCYHYPIKWGSMQRV